MWMKYFIRLFKYMYHLYFKWFFVHWKKCFSPTPPPPKKKYGKKINNLFFNFRYIYFVPPPPPTHTHSNPKYPPPPKKNTTAFSMIDYHMLFSLQEKTPLPNKETKHSGCVFCDSIFKNLVEKHHAIIRRKRPGGGRGRGRGGRGRGRGRGRPKPKDKMAQLAAYFV